MLLTEIFFFYVGMDCISLTWLWDSISNQIPVCKILQCSFVTMFFEEVENFSDHSFHCKNIWNSYKMFEYVIFLNTDSAMAMLQDMFHVFTQENTFRWEIELKKLKNVQLPTSFKIKYQVNIYYFLTSCLYTF